MARALSLLVGLAAVGLIATPLPRAQSAGEAAPAAGLPAPVQEAGVRAGENGEADGQEAPEPGSDPAGQDAQDAQQPEAPRIPVLPRPEPVHDLGSVDRPTELDVPGQVALVFEREVFSYPGAGRRDPFKPLTEETLGPLFEELTLRGIIYSPQPGESVALLADSGGRIYRVRAGEAVGNARVVRIDPLRVRFAVDNFGIVRQQQLELSRQEPEGARG